MKTISNKIICSLLITTIVVISSNILVPKKVQADNTVAGYITSLTPVIIKMPGCKKALGSGISELFKSVKNLFSSKIDSLESKGVNKVTGKISGALEEVGVADSETRAGIAEVKKIVTETDKSVKNQDNNENCLNGIGKAIAKVLVTEASNSIVNWIQTGDDGGPMFVQDPGAFFKNIAEDQILGFGTEIKDPTLFPFGKDFMQNQANTFKSEFAKTAQYSLDKIISSSNPNYSAQTFSQDFSQGGWDAWDALTQNPANNPLGFSLIASNEIAKRIQAETEAKKESLQQSGGFLGDQKCLDPKDVTKEEDENAKKGVEGARRCTGGFIDVTPGRLVGDRISDTVNKQDNSLLDVQTLNDALAAILDTVLEKFNSELQNNGLAEVDQSNPYDFNKGNIGFGNIQNEEDFSKGQINSSQWLSSHPDFNIRTDLNQALVDEQRIYRDKLEEQNKQIISETTNTNKDLQTDYYGLIPTIYQLDYCIPGPHPGYEEDAQAELGNIQDKLGSINFYDFTKDSWYSLGDSLTLGIFGSITEIINQYAFNCGSQVGREQANVFTKQFEDMTGFLAMNKDNKGNEAFCTIEGFNTATDRVEAEYERNIKETFDLKYLPSTAREAQTKFQEIPGYEKIVRDNRKTSDAITGTINRLINIKSKIDELNNDLKNKIIGETEYENKLVPWKNAFARLSSSLYSGDDIAEIDQATKGIVDEKDYIFKNLIKSETGCEKEVENYYPEPKYWQVGQSERPDYPKPHLYNYSGSMTPIFPWNKDKGIINKPLITKEGINVGKGFLGYVILWDSDECGNFKNANIICGGSTAGNSGTIPGTIGGATGTVVTGGGGDFSKEPNNLTGIIDVSGIMKTKHPHFGGNATAWEKALHIW